MSRKKKKIKKNNKKKIIKKIFKKKVKNNQTNQNNFKQGNVLRISKNYEQKVEIIKIKKQATEKRIYKIKDYVVYPKHGVGQICRLVLKLLAE
tara:strand:+ start:998 stop:1276 length:279 start_codon:yes stop_codon:yes gene_type:complete